MHKVVYNAEPFGYSENAQKLWGEKGYTYVAGSWNEVKEKHQFKGVHGLIVRLQEWVGAPLLAKFPDLKFVVSATTGHDHLDLDYLHARGIQLYSLRPHKAFLDTIPSTAEHTWALLMALFRRLPQANQDVKEGHWRRDLFRGHQLKGKVLGIIGLGRTGSKVARYAQAFDMKVGYYDPNVDSDAHTKYSSLEELLATSDIISLHVHLTDDTAELINKERLSSIKNGAFLINTSRGKICEENALVDALKQGSLKGVATDVLSTELGQMQESPLWQAQQQGLNVIVSPHIGGATWEAMWECEEFIAQKVTE